ncbi:autotransporter outer membrane beta-barrel domain-containing protein [Methylomonas koyamae]|uniref:autotransporter outer membrane beta-barrel domain-containing protein n=1 Tax=Methylomonas koyamae TaxID=702114 RepID=UPI00112DA9F4|nr:autotransporter outer membrane beta-barrel domain-containing protein [Methylomonas koyamae]TPQ26192.1 hypothetical protein C2U68_12500 [Methylomonas koyamae]
MYYPNLKPVRSVDAETSVRPPVHLQLCRAISLAVMTLSSASTSAVPSFSQNLNPNQQSVDTALSNCSSFYSDSNEPTPTVCQAGFSDIQSLTPDQVLGMGNSITRLDGGRNPVPYDYYSNNQTSRLGGGSGDADFPPLNFWTKVDSGFGAHDNTALNNGGFKYDNHNFMAGVDYRISDSWVSGAVFNYRHSNAAFNAGRGETLGDSYTGMLYTSYFVTEALHLDATASYGGHEFETTRNITLNGVSSVAKAKPNADQYSFSWGGGYDWHHQALSVSPYARGEYTALNIDGYAESGSVAAVRFGKQNIESLISTVGVQTAYTFSFPWGVLIPQLRGEWHHQFLDGRRNVSGSFIADGSGSTFSLVNDAPTRDYYTFGAEVSTVLPGGVSAFLAYETLQSYRHVESNRLMLGGRLEF